MTGSTNNNGFQGAIAGFQQRQAELVSIAETITQELRTLQNEALFNTSAPEAQAAASLRERANILQEHIDSFMQDAVNAGFGETLVTSLVAPLTRFQLIESCDNYNLILQLKEIDSSFTTSIQHLNVSKHPKTLQDLKSRVEQLNKGAAHPAIEEYRLHLLARITAQQSPAFTSPQFPAPPSSSRQIIAAQDLAYQDTQTLDILSRQYRQVQGLLDTPLEAYQQTIGLLKEMKSFHPQTPEAVQTLAQLETEVRELVQAIIETQQELDQGQLTPLKAHVQLIGQMEVFQPLLHALENKLNPDSHFNELSIDQRNAVYDALAAVGVPVAMTMKQSDVLVPSLHRNAMASLRPAFSNWPGSSEQKLNALRLILSPPLSSRMQQDFNAFLANPSAASQPASSHSPVAASSRDPLEFPCDERPDLEKLRDLLHSVNNEDEIASLISNLPETDMVRIHIAQHFTAIRTTNPYAPTFSTPEDALTAFVSGSSTEERYRVISRSFIEIALEQMYANPSNLKAQAQELGDISLHGIDRQLLQTAQSTIAHRSGLFEFFQSQQSQVVPNALPESILVPLYQIVHDLFRKTQAMASNPQINTPGFGEAIFTGPDRFRPTQLDAISRLRTDLLQAWGV